MVNHIKEEAKFSHNGENKKRPSSSSMDRRAVFSFSICNVSYILKKEKLIGSISQMGETDKHNQNQLSVTRKETETHLQHESSLCVL